MADGFGFPLADYTEAASPHEVTLVRRTLVERSVDGEPEGLNGDKAYESDRLDAESGVIDIEVMAAHKSNGQKAKRQGGRKMRRYKRRWKVERKFCVAAKHPPDSSALRIS